MFPGSVLTLLSHQMARIGHVGDAKQDEGAREEEIVNFVNAIVKMRYFVENHPAWTDKPVRPQAGKKGIKNKKDEKSSAKGKAGAPAKPRKTPRK